MELTPEEVRVLGVLVEKEATTPDQYPLSTNALTNGCNQKTSRDPVVDYDQRTVSETMLLLRPAGLARTIVSGRTEKHRHVLDEAWGLDPASLAVLAVLMLRGPQSPGELKTRTERAHGFADLHAVEAVLQQLAARSEPLVRNVGRASGQSQDRWVHLLSGSNVEASPMGTTTTAASVSEPHSARPPASPPPTSPPLAPRHDGADVAALEARVDDLEQRLAALEAELGL